MTKDNLLGIPDPVNGIPPKTVVSDVPEEMVLSELRKKRLAEDQGACPVCGCLHFPEGRCRHCGKARVK